MNANNRFMNYTIANIRVSLPDACTGEHFTRALRPFLTLGAALRTSRWKSSPGFRPKPITANSTSSSFPTPTPTAVRTTRRGP